MYFTLKAKQTKDKDYVTNCEECNMNNITVNIETWKHKIFNVEMKYVADKLRILLQLVITILVEDDKWNKMTWKYTMSQLQ